MHVGGRAPGFWLLWACSTPLRGGRVESEGTLWSSWARRSLGELQNCGSRGSMSLMHGQVDGIVGWELAWAEE